MDHVFVEHFENIVCSYGSHNPEHAFVFALDKLN